MKEDFQRGSMHYVKWGKMEFIQRRCSESRTSSSRSPQVIHLQPIPKIIPSYGMHPIMYATHFRSAILKVTPFLVSAMDLPAVVQLHNPHFRNLCYVHLVVLVSL